MLGSLPALGLNLVWLQTEHPGLAVGELPTPFVLLDPRNPSAELSWAGRSCQLAWVQPGHSLGTRRDPGGSRDPLRAEAWGQDMALGEGQNGLQRRSGRLL